MRISDWSSDVCSSDLEVLVRVVAVITILLCHAPEGGPRHCRCPETLSEAVVPGLVPGTQGPRRLKILPLRGEAFAAGGDAIVARHRHALMPMGPGDKRRDDSCAYGAVEKPPPAMCESGGDEHRNDGGVCLWPLRDRRATCADVVRGCRARLPRATPPPPPPPPRRGRPPPHQRT